MLRVSSFLYGTLYAVSPATGWPLYQRCRDQCDARFRVPFLNQSFFQTIDIADLATVDWLLQNAPNCIVNQIEFRVYGGQFLDWWTSVSQLKAVNGNLFTINETLK